MSSKDMTLHRLSEMLMSYGLSDCVSMLRRPRLDIALFCFVAYDLLDFGRIEICEYLDLCNRPFFTNLQFARDALREREGEYLYFLEKLCFELDIELDTALKKIKWCDCCKRYYK